ncbi:MAG: hypothetical protein ACRCT8_01445 [Lacipirellulaceae bacterium]
MRVRSYFTMSLVAASAVSAGCAGRLAYNLPPAQQMMHPGPGVGGPGPGVIPVGNQMTGPPSPEMYGPGGTPGAGQCATTRAGSSDVRQVQYCEGGSCSIGGGGGCAPGAGGPATSQIAFVGEEGIQVAWDVASQGQFDSAPLYVPGRQDFPQGAIYRLKVSNIPGRAGVTLYPTLEVAPVTPRTDAYLAHAPIPVQFTEEDFDQVVGGNFVTKVIYLPDPEFQELALSGVETLVSTRLDPGVDPIEEADRRGSILAILRMGSKDLGTSGGLAGIVPAGYGAGCDSCGPGGVSGGYEGAPYGGGPMYGEGAPMMQGPGGDGMMPMGAPTAGFAPNVMPPHMMAGMQPQYGMPYTGTPIGLPGPPHIPLGSPAGLRSHVMKNRTRVVMPPPTNQMTISVKQRPGMNYPRPATHVHVDEVHRAPFRPFGGTVPNPVSAAAQRLQAAGQSMDGASMSGECP